MAVETKNKIAENATENETEKAARSVLVEFTNNTTRNLVLRDQQATNGKWTEGEFPPSKINAGGRARWGTQSNGIGTGTKGYVVYSIQDASEKSGDVRMDWDNPFVGNKSYSGSAPVGFAINYSGGEGNNAVVYFKLTQPGGEDAS